MCCKNLLNFLSRYKAILSTVLCIILSTGIIIADNSSKEKITNKHIKPTLQDSETSQWTWGGASKRSCQHTTREPERVSQTILLRLFDQQTLLSILGSATRSSRLLMQGSPLKVAFPLLRYYKNGTPSKIKRTSSYVFVFGCTISLQHVPIV